MGASVEDTHDDLETQVFNAPSSLDMGTLVSRLTGSNDEISETMVAMMKTMRQQQQLL